MALLSKKSDLHFAENLSKKQLIEVLNYINVTLAILDINGNIIYSNPKSLEQSYSLFQKYPDLNDTIWNYLEPEYHQKFKELMDKSFHGELIHVPVKLRNINHQDCWFDYTFFPIKGDDGLVNLIGVSSNEITAQKKAEQTLKENESLFRSIVQDQTESICRYYPDGVLIFVNNSYCELFGRSESELIGQNLFQLVPESIRDGMFKKLQELTPNNPIQHYNQFVFDSFGKSHWLSCTDRAIFDDAGIIVQIQSVGRDITTQVMLEKALEKSMKQFEAILKSIPDPIFVFDSKGNILDCFASKPEYLRAPINEIVNKNICNFFPLEVGQKTKDVIQECLHSKREKLLEYETDINGEKHYYESKIVFLEEGKVLAISRNITARKVAENQLIQSESLYRNLIETSPDAIVIATLDKRVLYVSPRTIQLFGCNSSSEMLGSKVNKWIDDGSIPLAQKMFQKLINDKETVFEQFKLLRKDKSPFMGEVSCNCICSKDGNIWGFMLVIRDVTQRLNSEFQLKLLYKAIEQCPVSVIITDILGNIEYVNETFTRNNGYQFSEVLGNSPAILRPEEFSEKIYEELWYTLRNGNEWKGELINRHKNGSLHWQSVVIAPVKGLEGRVTHYIGVQDDISERKSYEENLIRAKNKAEESDRLKTAFLNNISHEIRTPMNGIVGFSYLLNEKGLGPELISNYTSIIKTSCEKLLAIITDIVDISKIEAGVVDLEEQPIDLNLMMTQVVEKFQNLASAKGINLRRFGDQQLGQNVIMADLVKLTQVLDHLINNAIKFSNNNFIDIGYCVKNEHVEFVITDYGIGISLENQYLIFDRFWQYYNEYKTTQSGLGLGLSISKSFIEKMGGKMWVESELGKGASFFFTLPIKHDSYVHAIKANNQKVDIDYLSSFNGKIFLIAEDDEINYYYFKVILEKVGAKVFWAKNGEEAIRFVKNNPAHIVLMDIKMPFMNGFEATRIIKRSFPNLPIIALSAFTDNQDKMDAIKVGCNEYLCKPIDLAEFYEKIGFFLYTSVS